MLLCDDCDRGFHADCLNPALMEIPEEEWFCDACNPENKPSTSKEAEQQSIDLINILSLHYKLINPITLSIEQTSL